MSCKQSLANEETLKGLRETVKRKLHLTKHQEIYLNFSFVENHTLHTCCVIWVLVTEMV